MRVVLDSIYYYFIYHQSIFFKTLVTIYHTARRHAIEDSCVVPCEIFISPTDSPKAVCSTSMSEKLQNNLGAWTNPFMTQ